PRPPRCSRAPKDAAVAHVPCGSAVFVAAMFRWPPTRMPAARAPEYPRRTWTISGGGPVDPRQRTSVDRARLHASASAGFFVARERKRSMANHLTPDELAKELNMDRESVIKICIAEGVPIYQGKIDKHLFQAQLQAATVSEAAAHQPAASPQPKRPPRGPPWPPAP